MPLGVQENLRFPSTHWVPVETGKHFIVQSSVLSLLYTKAPISKTVITGITPELRVLRQRHQYTLEYVLESVFPIDTDERSRISDTATIRFSAYLCF